MQVHPDRKSAVRLVRAHAPNFGAHSLALKAVVRVLFAAEPAPCQGGGLNYTVWFPTGGPSGNPWRRDGYFSVVLNRPYEGNDPRTEVMAPALALYRRYAGEAWVEANEAFLEVCATGAPTRRKA